MHQSILSWHDSLASLAALSGDRERNCAGFLSNWINWDSFLKSVCAKTWYKLGWTRSKLENTKNGSYLRIRLRFYVGSIYLDIVHWRHCFQVGISLVLYTWRFLICALHTWERQLAETSLQWAQCRCMIQKWNGFQQIKLWSFPLFISPGRMHPHWDQDFPEGHTAIHVVHRQPAKSLTVHLMKESEDLVQTLLKY